MHKTKVKGLDICIHSYNTVIVGSGVASFNGAKTLYDMGQKDIALVTEGINMGTSRNTGSDKQTYYKLSTSGGEGDSPMDMAKTLYDGGAMHGDIALIEAAMSSRCFYRLVELGVDFPSDAFGQFVGYRTDHDIRKRATSAGPFTSKIMTEKLEDEVSKRNIPIYDRHQVIGIFSNGKETKGLMTIDHNEDRLSIVLFNCVNIMYGTGGPGDIYYSSVYPRSQHGAMGYALEAGAKAVNITEWQYGLASVKPRWNLSGTYQQVIPRYVSTDQNGEDEREFLQEYFSSSGKMMDAIFLKGYQWPFDPRKVSEEGSSLIDLLVYEEKYLKGRRVYLDFMHNPLSHGEDKTFMIDQLGEEAYEYLEKSKALFGTPIQRLAQMNKQAIEVYSRCGIDLYKEYLEVDVCAQHHNGGLLGNTWWESNLKHFFPVGEANGTLGVYRPGGSALNSTQVGSMRAATYIAEHYSGSPINEKDFIESVTEQLLDKLKMIAYLIENKSKVCNAKEIRQGYQKRMSKIGAFIREAKSINQGIITTGNDYNTILQEHQITQDKQVGEFFRNRNILITQQAVLSAIDDYIHKGGSSRGSYMIMDKESQVSAGIENSLCETSLHLTNDALQFQHKQVMPRPIPQDNSWFEKVYNVSQKS